MEVKIDFGVICSADCTSKAIRIRIKFCRYSSEKKLTIGFDHYTLSFGRTGGQTGVHTSSSLLVYHKLASRAIHDGCAQSIHLKMETIPAAELFVSMVLSPCVRLRSTSVDFVSYQYVFGTVVIQNLRFVDFNSCC